MSSLFHRNAFQQHADTPTDIPVKSLHLFTAQREDFRIHTRPVKSQGARKTHCYLCQAAINSSSQLFTRPSVTSLQLPCFHQGAHSEQTSVQLKVYTSRSQQLRLWCLLRCSSNLLIHPLRCRHDGVELFHLFGRNREQPSQLLVDRTAHKQAIIVSFLFVCFLNDLLCCES